MNKTKKLRCFRSMTDANEFIDHHKKHNPVKKDMTRQYSIRKRNIKKSNKRPYQVLMALSSNG